MTHMTIGMGLNSLELYLDWGGRGDKWKEKINPNAIPFTQKG
jgi:hypothetical protein